MPGENSISELKVNLWMPLDIGPFLQDTAHLNTEEIGAYTLLLIYYWAHGPLPNDPRRLANIAKMGVDTWSITQEALSMYFSVGSDGLLHQKGADRRRAQWLDKRLKAREKAIKAITARWSKHRAKLAAIRDTPSIPEGLRREVLENYPTSEVQVQKQEQELPPTPTASRRGIEAGQAQELHATPASMPQAPAAGKPNGQASAIANAAVPGVSPGAGKSEHKGKGPETGSVARREGRDDVSHVAGRPAALAVRGTVSNNGKKLGVRPSKPVQRADQCKSEVLAYWRGQNPKHPKCPWGDAEDRALGALLRASPDLTPKTLHELLVARAHSEVNPAALPHKWLRSIQEYAAGSLGKYGKPLPQARNF